MFFTLPRYLATNEWQGKLFKNVITRDETWVFWYEAKHIIAVEELRFVVFQKDVSAFEI
jgi:hypothetical protein